VFKLWQLLCANFQDHGNGDILAIPAKAFMFTFGLHNSKGRFIKEKACILIEYGCVK
jgi:hypothetical protein